ncbi:hypothetical protein A2962_00495 [Candidatus Woesebacteria bacterium RIFCSPLOWO2_01_FULL_39_61]|uniref:Blue (type 1) copper domain-containing protein n=1 Tax=Candidatus Woesebacteria bacterium RIFCSPHIGHO2_02_FULL_39_13 TaxID=1802505 RepID=A0A1F7Z2A2_9BACT|nr:MAG: hypothetical protein A2692_03735 [Candidatus Woesebacteria bacterium RIFCSPHIGHO2_01_FULL_39_95]OGM33610.1 MAG: hypothetical protein A3D01_01500 [Candidatus Woesebacteria bacterium RIFCSPHIGHO2_02_FULL_39_13]OGM37302.1 MAG: hypothetical protein A3E13_05205 [Candidatus Woesebacteria bacterium RIFCSPHIGHO2_12_FULL_40_20]OGM68532.1 MAG: hypothetical protein A2962_00495 [Candidatus Woesebacteria bacterium RIFCSPLOWO2_01_FULL_39_61]OGM73449.1 MAG: hypothetical protein A3H19_00845 [Candidatus
MNKALLVIIVILLLGGGAFFLLRQGPRQNITSSNDDQNETLNINNFSIPKKAAHYESNTPEHGAILAGAPVFVVINFNFDLAAPSEIIVYSSGVKNPKTGTTSPIDITSGKTTIDANKLSMRRAIIPDAPDDFYTVDYKACWADGSCHDGQFQFKIDRTQAANFVDMTGQDEVTINLRNFAFNPAKIRVSKATKVTWVNQDNVVHTVNTDSHPAHSYYPDQNSRNLSKGDTYSVTFSQPGIYPYHCTPHANTMKGQILVE